MNAATLDLESCTIHERVELLGRVWDSLIDANGAPPIPDWHLREVAARIARADAEPGRGIPLEQLRRELLAERNS